jgi:hypothetical protein
MTQGRIAPTGTLTARLIRGPRVGWSYKLRNFPNIWRGLWRYQVARMFGIATIYGELYAVLRHADGTTLNYGRISTRVVTTAGMNWLVSAFANTVELEIMKYHGVGTGTTAEAAADTALVTESTTALNPDSTRATGTTTVGASNNIYRTVGTATFDASAAITEHGVFSQAATGGGTLIDRSVFSAINVVSGDSIQFTYELTFATGG